MQLDKKECEKDKSRMINDCRTKLKGDSYIKPGTIDQRCSKDIKFYFEISPENFYFQSKHHDGTKVADIMARHKNRHTVLKADNRGFALRMRNVGVAKKGKSHHSKESRPDMYNWHKYLFMLV